MGAKSAAVVFAQGWPADLLASCPAHDPAQAADVAARVFPDRTCVRVEDDDFLELYPGEDELIVGCYPGVVIVAAQDLGGLEPEEMEQSLIRLVPATTVLHHSMHSVVDWFAYSLWQDGRLVRALSVSPDDGVMTDVGERQPFEVPYWNGEHPWDDEEPDEDPEALPFHPLELGSAVSLAILGLELEGCTSYWRFDPDELRATRFQMHKAGQPRPRPRREMPPPPPRRPPPRASRWWWPF